MFFIEAKKEILKKYRLSEFSIDIDIINTGKFFDFSEGYFIALVCVDGMAELTDMGKTCDIVDCSQEELKELCDKYGLQLNEWTIETKFNSIDDLDNFIALLDELSVRYSEDQ